MDTSKEYVKMCQKAKEAKQLGEKNQEWIGKLVRYIDSDTYAVIREQRETSVKGTWGDTIPEAIKAYKENCSISLWIDVKNITEVK